MITVSQLKPAVILVHRCSRRGGVQYIHAKETLVENPEESEARREHKKWEGERIISDKEEFEKAQKLQSACKYAISQLGRSTSLGILVNEEKLTEADESIQEWSKKIDEFNATAKHTQIENFVMKFVVSGDNKKVLEMMLRDLGELLETLTEALSAADPKSIRDVLRKLKNATELLPEVATDLVKTAIDGAREKAKEIVKAQKAFNEAADDRAEKLADLEALKKQIDTSPVKLARFAVLLPGDAEEATEDKSGTLVGVQMRRRFAALSASEPATA